MSVLAELQQIERKNGVLRPEDVVSFARNPKTELHGRFTWDDTTAAEQYRLWQARQVIRVSVTMLDTPKGQREIRAFVSLMDDRTQDGGGYRSTMSVLKHDDRRSTMLTEALAELHVFRRKYAMLKELAGVWSAIDEALG